MLKPKSSQGNVCTHAYTKQVEVLKKSASQKLMATVFWDRKGALMVEFMHKKTTITSI
jgi:hypothetical protein